MDDVNGEVLLPLKFFLKTYTKNLTNPFWDHLYLVIFPLGAAVIQIFYL